MRVPHAPQNSRLRLPTGAKLLPALSLAALMAACAGTPYDRPAAPAPAPGAVPGTVVAPAPQAAAPAQLQAYDWDLVAMVDARGGADTRWRLPGQRAPRLHFDNGRLSVQHLCNVIGSSYTLQGDRITLSPAVSTMRACPEAELMRLEERLRTQLGTAQRLEMRTGGAAPLLVLHFADGSRWELAGTPTPQTRYGGAGERLFLEVAPYRVPCNHGVVANAQCLRVREVRFADHGVRQGVGEWQPLYTEIEGYTHEPGVRNVLRLNRFQRPQAPADASSTVYVLDMVVETERVR